MLNKKMIGLILKLRTLRLALLIALVFMIILTGLIVLNLSFSKKLSGNEIQLVEIRRQLEELEKIASEGAEIVSSQASERFFAPYDQIVPYISLLESLFAIIDKDSEILVKDQESQIYVNRYADYQVRLNPGNKMGLLLKALDELYRSKYISKVTRFAVNYEPSELGEGNEVDEVELTIRLYFE